MQQGELPLLSPPRQQPRSTRPPAAPPHQEAAPREAEGGAGSFSMVLQSMSDSVAEVGETISSRLSLGWRSPPPVRNTALVAAPPPQPQSLDDGGDGMYATDEPEAPAEPWLLASLRSGLDSVGTGLTGVGEQFSSGVQSGLRLPSAAFDSVAMHFGRVAEGAVDVVRPAAEAAAEQYQATARRPSPHHQHEPQHYSCLLYTSPSPRDRQKARMPSSA